MTEPQGIYAPLIKAIESLTQETKAQRTDISGLSSVLRDQNNQNIRRIGVLQRLLAVLSIVTVFLLLLAGLNAYNLNKINDTAADAKSTNEFLLSCTQPDTECTNRNRLAEERQQNGVRQTQLTIAFCQRSFPVPQNATPQQANESADKVIACVQQYYPNFELPNKVNR